MPQTKKTNRGRKLKFSIHKKSQEEIENIPLKKLIYFSLFLNIATGVLVIILKNHLPPTVPLYYGLAKSEAQLVRQNFLILPSLVALCFVVVNIFVSIFFENEFIKKTLIAGGFVTSVLSTITVLEIIFLVGSF